MCENMSSERRRKRSRLLRLTVDVSELSQQMADADGDEQALHYFGEEAAAAGENVSGSGSGPSLPEHNVSGAVAAVLSPSATGGPSSATGGPSSATGREPVPHQEARGGTPAPADTVRSADYAVTKL